MKKSTLMVMVLSIFCLTSFTPASKKSPNDFYVGSFTWDECPGGYPTLVKVYVDYTIRTKVVDCRVTLSSGTTVILAATGTYSGGHYTHVVTNLPKLTGGGPYCHVDYSN